MLPSFEHMYVAGQLASEGTMILQLSLYHIHHIFLSVHDSFVVSDAVQTATT
jgi:hypothetical protein